MGILEENIGSWLGTRSQKWQEWFSKEDNRRCKDCEDLTGKIFPIGETIIDHGKNFLADVMSATIGLAHLYCRCTLEAVPLIKAGNLTQKGIAGADYWLKKFGRLPDDYITEDELLSKGWKNRKKVSKFAPGMQLTKVYHNYEGKLPSEAGRVWHEADFDYVSGKRNAKRILFSNDGLIFATFDHCTTFYEIA